MTIARQYNLLGDLVLPDDLSKRKKVGFILEQHPETCNHDGLLVLWYWWEIEGLNTIIDPDQFEALLKWAEKAEKPETIRRRRQELNEDGLYLPSPTEAAYRKEQAHAGSLGRRR